MVGRTRGGRGGHEIGSTGVVIWNRVQQKDRHARTHGIHAFTHLHVFGVHRQAVFHPPSQSQDRKENLARIDSKNQEQKIHNDQCERGKDQKDGGISDKSQICTHRETGLGMWIHDSSAHALTPTKPR